MTPNNEPISLAPFLAAIKDHIAAKGRAPTGAHCSPALVRAMLAMAWAPRSEPEHTGMVFNGLAITCAPSLPAGTHWVFVTEEKA